MAVDLVLGVAFSPDGQRVATASMDSTARLWDAESGRSLLTLRGHTQFVSGVAFSPDGKRLATASADGTAKIWDVVSGQELLTFRVSPLSVNNVAFAPDGKRLVAASDTGIRIYALDIEDLLVAAKRHVTRPFTSEECKIYFQGESCPTVP